METPPPALPALSRYAAFTALATLGLIALGGLVTSHGAGMAVPDWPTTYGYNMFLFPISQWVGGIFYEHTHRLYASAVGLLTVILAFWLHVRAPRRSWAVMGWAALALVIVQGLLGGLRVTLMRDALGVVHASLAQGFLVLVAAIAVVTSRTWAHWRTTAVAPGKLMDRFVLGVTVLIFVQLALGATMRHQHAGLAVPDFPMAYGRIYPPTDDAFLGTVNALRADSRDFRPITAAHVHLHMTHRALGFGLVTLVLIAGIRLRRTFGSRSSAGRLGTAWMATIVLQLGLGAATVWSNKAADMATAHVVVGAVSLLLGVVATMLCHAARSPLAEPSRGHRRAAPYSPSPAAPVPEAV